MFTNIETDWKPGVSEFKTPGIDWGVPRLKVRGEAKQDDGSYLVAAFVGPSKCWSGIGMAPRYVPIHFVILRMTHERGGAGLSWYATPLLRFDQREAKK